MFGVLLVFVIGVFNVEGSFFASGSKERANELSARDRARIAAFCRERLSGSSYPLARFYPDVAAV